MCIHTLKIYTPEHSNWETLPSVFLNLVIDTLFAAQSAGNLAQKRGGGGAIYGFKNILKSSFGIKNRKCLKIQTKKRLKEKKLI